VARPYDIDDAKGILELICRRLGIGVPAYEPTGGEPLLHPGRGALVRAEQGGTVVLGGILGELNPGLSDPWELRGARVVIAELDIAGLAGGRPSAVVAAPPPRHPAAERDLAVVVDAGRPAGDIITTIRAHGGAWLADATLFDVYRGTPLEATEKSLAVRLSFRSPDRTLTEAEIDGSIEAIRTGLATDIGARIRT
jgi:phenylalanyl-tRNA synthetase beta chain